MDSEEMKVKKFLAVFLAIVMVLSMAACGKKDKPVEEKIFEFSKEFECGVTISGTSVFEDLEITAEAADAAADQTVVDAMKSVSEKYSVYMLDAVKGGESVAVKTAKISFMLGDLDPAKAGVYRIVKTVEGMELKQLKSDVITGAGTVEIEVSNDNLGSFIVCETESKVIESTDTNDSTAGDDKAEDGKDSNTGNGSSSGSTSGDKTNSGSGSGSSGKPSGGNSSSGSGSGSGSGGSSSGGNTPQPEPKPEKWVYDKDCTRYLLNFYNVGETDRTTWDNNDPDLGTNTSHYCSKEAVKTFNEVCKQYINGQVSADHVKSVLTSTVFVPSTTGLNTRYTQAAVSNFIVGPCSSDTEAMQKAIQQATTCSHAYGYIEVYKNDVTGAHHVYMILAGAGVWV